jgi:predicted murein hydrolase (TIGR00659 family)
MKSTAANIWVYLSASPLLWLTLTLAAYLLAFHIQIWLRRSPIANSVAIAVAFLVVLLLFTGTSYETYFDGAQFVHFLLGPAVVALAIPLRENFATVRRSVVPMVAALFAGSLTAIFSAGVVAWALGADLQTIKSLIPKSVTAPIAMGIAQEIGGLPSLTAALTVLTGVLGAMFGGPVLDLLGIKLPAARGLGLGTASHGIGTARAFQESEIAGTFAAIALGLNGLLTAVLVPLLLTLVRTN